MDTLLFLIKIGKKTLFLPKPKIKFSFFQKELKNQLFRSFKPEKIVFGCIS